MVKPTHQGYGFNGLVRVLLSEAFKGNVILARPLRLFALVLLLVGFGLTGCSSEQLTTDASSLPATTVTTSETSSTEQPTTDAHPSSKLNIFSDAWQDGGTIPTQYSCEGSDISPPLLLDGIPPATRSLALIMNDPDAPSGNFVHWVIFNLDPGRVSISEGLGRPDAAAVEGSHGMNDFGELGYRGPCPPRGSTHTYVLTAYALDRVLELPSGVTAGELLAVTPGSVLSSATLQGTFGRS